MIRYLYEYRDGRRIRNVGFVKAEQDEAAGTLQIHGRATLLNSADVRVYLFFTNGEKCFGIPMGELHGMQSILNARLSYDREEIEKYTDFDAVRGLILDAGDQGTFAAVWDESVVPVEKMRLAPERTKLPFQEEAGPETEPVEESKPAEENKPAEETEQSGETEAAEETEQSGETEAAEETEQSGETEAAEVTGPSGETKSVGETEAPENINAVQEAEEMDLEADLPAGAPLNDDRENGMSEEPVYDLPEGGAKGVPRSRNSEMPPQKRSRSCQELAKTLNAVKTMEPVETNQIPDKADEQKAAERTAPQYRKISREDLRELPRRDRYLANNSFLLHGYYNYKHLMFIEDGEDFYLGVPGIYHPREALAAGSFGFPVFREISRQKSRSLNLSAQEINENEIFGYWCRRIKKSQP